VIADLKPYPAMKDSGVPWLGELPEHWRTERAKWLFRKMNRPVRDSDEVVTCFRDGTVTLRRNRRVRGFTESLKEIGYQGIRRGDLVIHAMDAFAGAIGVAESDGKGTPVYSVCEPRPIADSHFYAYAVREMSRSQWIQALAKGIRERSTDFRFEAFGFQTLPLPPRPEQAAIVRFLDHADRRIRQYIRAKQRLIKLLEEQKQAIIHRAVTRGLDPNVRLKPSGVEWLGDVPEHWEVLKLARVIADGPRNGISPAIDERGNIESFSISAIRNGRVDVRDADKKYVSGDKNTLETTYCLLRGDVLLVRGNGNLRLVGKGGLVAHDMPGRVYPDLLMRIRLTPRCLPQFLVALLTCRAGRDQIETAARTAVGTFKINNQQVRQLCFAFPPVGEQESIVRSLDSDLSPLAVASSRAEEEIELLREYRTRLIADVVTGKLDVREAAARLPQEAEDLDPLDEAEALGEAEGESAAEDFDPTPKEAEA